MILAGFLMTAKNSRKTVKIDKKPVYSSWTSQFSNFKIQLVHVEYTRAHLPLEYCHFSANHPEVDQAPPPPALTTFPVFGMPTSGHRFSESVL